MTVKNGNDGRELSVNMRVETLTRQGAKPTDGGSVGVNFSYLMVRFKYVFLILLLDAFTSLFNQFILYLMCSF